MINLNVVSKKYPPTKIVSLNVEFEIIAHTKPLCSGYNTGGAAGTCKMCHRARSTHARMKSMRLHCAHTKTVTLFTPLQTTNTQCHIYLTFTYIEQMFGAVRFVWLFSLKSLYAHYVRRCVCVHPKFC